MSKLKGNLPPGEGIRKDKVRIQNKIKVIEQERGTHFLEIAEGGTSQDMERKQPSKVHSQTEDHRGRDKSEHGKKATK